MNYIHKVKETINAGPVSRIDLKNRLGLNDNQLTHAIGELVKQGLCKRLPKKHYVGVAQ